MDQVLVSNALLIFHMKYVFMPMACQGKLLSSLCMICHTNFHLLINKAKCLCNSYYQYYANYYYQYYANYANYYYQYYANSYYQYYAASIAQTKHIIMDHTAKCVTLFALIVDQSIANSIKKTYLAVKAIHIFLSQL